VTTEPEPQASDWALEQIRPLFTSAAYVEAHGCVDANTLGLLIDRIHYEAREGIPQGAHHELVDGVIAGIQSLRDGEEPSADNILASILFDAEIALRAFARRIDTLEAQAKEA
jgi:hypothetical protein